MTILSIYIYYWSFDIFIRDWFLSRLCYQASFPASYLFRTDDSFVRRGHHFGTFGLPPWRSGLADIRPRKIFHETFVNLMKQTWHPWSKFVPCDDADNHIRFLLPQMFYFISTTHVIRVRSRNISSYCRKVMIFGKGLVSHFKRRDKFCNSRDLSLD